MFDWRPPLLLLFWHQTEAAALKAALWGLKVALVANALAAISIGPIPVPWIGTAWLLCFSAILAFYPLQLYIRGRWLIWMFVAWAIAVQWLNLGGPLVLMPEEATTSYTTFVALRYVTLLAFIATMEVSAWIIRKGLGEQLIRWLTKFGAVLSVVAIYVYIANIYGLPDIPRTRAGTAGGEAQAVFTYAFYRATGTFREPGNMAAWLVLPFFLSFVYTKAVLNWRSILIGSVILLSGSLSAILAIAIGGGLALVVTLLKGAKYPGWLLKAPLKIAALVAVSLIPFYFIVQASEDGTIHVFNVVADRVAPIIAGGLIESNRGFVYEYMRAVEFPWLGQGLGTANLFLTRHFLNSGMMSFVSLYLNVLYSTGVVGLVLLLLFLTRPLTTSHRHVPSQQLWPILSAYFAWLVMFLVTSEELPMIFGVAYALMATLYRKPQA